MQTTNETRPARTLSGRIEEASAASETSAANQHSLTPEQEKAIDIIERSFGKRGADPVNRLGRKRLCLKTHTVYMQVFSEGDVIGHIQRTARRGVYDCFHDGNNLGLRFNITEGVDLVMNTNKQTHTP